MTRDESHQRLIVVIGGGVAGVEAALAAQRAGFRVLVAEEGARLGSDVDLLPPSCAGGKSARETFSGKLSLLEEAGADIAALTGVRALSGEAPRFSVTLRTRPAVVAAPGPLGLAREGRMREARRSAALLNPLRRDDEDACGARARQGRSTRHEGVREVVAAAVILAPPAVEFDASALGEYGLGRYANVITRGEFERMLTRSAAPARPSDGSEVRSAAFVQCVGSRSSRASAHPWCSAVCCSHALSQAARLRELAGECRVKLFYVDLMAVGKGCEEFAARVRGGGVECVRSLPASVREGKAERDLHIKHVDGGGRVVEEAFGLVVLSTGVEPPRDFSRTAARLDVKLDEDGFAATNESSPSDTSRRGVFTCGIALGPAGFEQTAASARAAVARACEIASPAPVTGGEGAGERVGVLVVGGGFAGMRAALSLARRGITSRIVEREGELGGNARFVRGTIGGSDGREMLASLIAEVTSNEYIDVRTGGAVVSHEGVPGAFEAVVETGGVERRLAYGAVIVATGARACVPEEYMYGADKRVITQHALESELAGDFECAGAVVMIQCVGSRDQMHPWCSRVCCAQALKNALRLKRESPGRAVYVLHRDVRSFGRLDALYGEARGLGVRFIRFPGESRAEVRADARALTVEVFDCDLGRKVELDAGRVVLSAGVEPRADSREVAGMFGLEAGANGFLEGGGGKGVDFLDRGVYLCGMARAPVLLEEAIHEALSAAAQAATFIEAGRNGRGT